MEWWQFIESWRWWRHVGHDYSRWDSFLYVIEFNIKGPLRGVYACVWLKWQDFKARHIPWCKYNKMRREIERLENKLFGEE